MDTIQLAFTKKEFLQHFTRDFANEIIISKEISEDVYSTEDVYNTFLYIYEKIQCGNYVQYYGKLSKWISFVSNEKNEWENSMWRTDNGILYTESPPVYKFKNLEIFTDMLNTLKYNGELEFFVNINKFPILSSKRCEPYTNIYGSRIPLKSNNFATYAPIFSTSSCVGFEDVLIPSSKDWARCVSLEQNRIFPKKFKNYNFNHVDWNLKLQKAIFRGSNAGRLHPNNQRINICSIKDYRLDAAITRWKCKFIQEGNIREFSKKIDNISYDDTYTFQKLVNCKFIIHVDGHSTSHRLGLELASGSCVIIVQSKWKCWYSDMLVPFKHFLPVSEDLSDLQHVLDWCFENDEKCKKIAQNAVQFYNDHLKMEHIIKYLEKVMQKYVYKNTHPTVSYDTFLSKTVPKFNFTVPFFLKDNIDDNVKHINLQMLSVNDQLSCFFQTLVIFQYLQWHYSAYIEKFKFVIVRASESVVINEYYDHYFTVNYKIYLYDISNVYYVTEDEYTNYDENIVRDNMSDMLHYFSKGHCVLRNMCSEIANNKSTFKETIEYIYSKFYKEFHTKIHYVRKYPTPLLKLPANINIHQYPLPFDYTTNKLIVYRQWQLLQNYHFKYFADAISKISATNVGYNIYNFDIPSFVQVKYNKYYNKNYNFDVIQNDSKYIRLVRELLGFIKMEDDLNFYRNLFKPLLMLDKVQYTINFAKSKTISAFANVTHI